MSKIYIYIIFFIISGHYLFSQPGSIDISFAGIISGFNGEVKAICLQSDGKILVGGNFTTYNSIICPANFIRLNSDGTVDNTFTGLSTGFDSYVTSIAVQNNGHILVGGNFTTYNTFDCSDCLVRLDEYGNVDGTFSSIGSGFNAQVRAIALRSDNRIMVGGDFDQLNGNPCPRAIICLDVNGVSFPPFSGMSGFGNVNAFVSAIAIQSNGDILVGGGYLNLFTGSPCPNGLIRISGNDGALDGTFNNSGAGFNTPLDAYVKSLAIQSDGKIIVGGSFSSYNAVNCPNNFVRLTTSGAIDGTFTGLTSAGFNGGVETIAVQTDGRILVGGYFSTYNGAACPSNIIRLTSTGAYDYTIPGLTSGFNDRVNDIKLQTDGQILVGGLFTSYNGLTNHNRLIRLNGGSCDTIPLLPDWGLMIMLLGIFAAGAYFIWKRIV